MHLLPANPTYPLHQVGYFIEDLKWGESNPDWRDHPRGPVERSGIEEVCSMLRPLIEINGLQAELGTARELLMATEYYARSISEQTGSDLLEIRTALVEGIMLGLGLAGRCYAPPPPTYIKP